MTLITEHTDTAYLGERPLSRFLLPRRISPNQSPPRGLRGETYGACPERWPRLRQHVWDLHPPGGTAAASFNIAFLGDLCDPGDCTHPSELESPHPAPLAVWA